MSWAIELAKEAAGVEEVPVGCVIVEEHGAIVGQGYNTRERDHDPTAHAEIIAIRQASKALKSWRLLHCTLYVTLEPCIQCVGAMLLARIPRVVFGCHDPKGGALGSVVDLRAVDGVNHSLDVTSGVMADQCAAVLKEFFRKLREGGDGGEK